MSAPADAPPTQDGPWIDPDAWVAPSAQLYGRIRVEAGASIWHNAVARAECVEIQVGRMSNVQDFAMIHVGYTEPTRIGAFCSITHRAVVHGCTLGDDVLVGIGAVVMDGAVVGAGSIVAAGAVLLEGKEFPPHSVIAGVPGKVIAERDSSRENRMNAWMYHRNAQAYRRGDHRAWVGPEFERWQAAKRAEVDADRDR